MIPKVLLSLNDYEADVEMLGVTPNEMGIPETDSDMALDITSKFLADPRCAFLAAGSFASHLREKGRLCDFYKAV